MGRSEGELGPGSEAMARGGWEGVSGAEPERGGKENEPARG